MPAVWHGWSAGLIAGRPALAAVGPYGRGIDPMGIAAARRSLSQLGLSAVSARGVDNLATIPVDLEANPYEVGQLALAARRHTFVRE
jgi:hypothetical protein